MLACLVLGSPHLVAQQGNVDANAMIKRCRLAVAAQKIDLVGRLRKQGIPNTPVQVFVRENNLQFRVRDGLFHLRLGESGAELFTLDTSGGLKPFPANRLIERIAGTDVTFEDFALLFLYWPNAQLQGEDTVDGEKCFRIQINNPGKDGAFQSVLVWIHKKYGAFWRIKGFDKEGKTLKQFQIRELMTLPNSNDHAIKCMQVSALNKEERVQSITYIEFESPKPRGLH